MPQIPPPERDVEIVLLKQLASCLDMPMFVVGTRGDLLFFNEPGELILGQRFDETGELRREDWLGLLRVSDEDGSPLEVGERALVVALERRRPAHRRFRMRGLDGRDRRIEGTALPLIAQDGRGGGRMLGALGMFWEPDTAERGAPERAEAPRASRQHAVETILTRRLAARLSTPGFLVDPNGGLLYFNEAAAPILGGRFADLGQRPVSGTELYERFRPRNTDGSELPPEAHPLTIARTQRQPVNGELLLQGLDGVDRTIEATAIPLVGQCGRTLGAFGVFWEREAA